MNSKLLILAVLTFVLSALSLYLWTNLNSKNEIISALDSKIEVLERKIKNGESRIAELEELQIEAEEKLSQVRHFDNSASNYRALSVSYTGGVIETQIDGTFEGWEGETVFRMRNGSIWQQASYAYTYHYAYAPDVLIYSKNGITYMKVEGVDDEIQVRRLK